jgi:hypothetical protein
VGAELAVLGAAQVGDDRPDPAAQGEHVHGLGRRAGQQHLEAVVAQLGQLQGVGVGVVVDPQHGRPFLAGGRSRGRPGPGFPGQLAGHVGLKVGDLAAELLGGLLDRQLDPANLDREAAGPHGSAQVGDHAGDMRDHPDQEHGHQQRPQQAADGLDDPGRGHPLPPPCLRGMSRPAAES